jgi:hypothetical protein
MKTRAIFFAVLILALFGCQTAPVNLHRQVPVHSMIHLNTELTFHPGVVGLYIQDGQIVKPNSIDSYRPHCSIELDTKAHRVTRIQPDSFIVYRVRYEENNASLGMPSSILSVAINSANGISWELYSTVLYLKSERQPQIYRMVCEHLDDPQDPKHVSIEQIKHTLGELMHLEVRYPR